MVPSKAEPSALVISRVQVIVRKLSFLSAWATDDAAAGPVEGPQRPHPAVQVAVHRDPGWPTGRGPSTGSAGCGAGRPERPVDSGKALLNRYNQDRRRSLRWPLVRASGSCFATDGRIRPDRGGPSRERHRVDRLDRRDGVTPDPDRRVQRCRVLRREWSTDVPR
jgi:hypothetical protein